MKILALDLGTKTGFCFEAENYARTFGTWELASAKSLRFAKKLRMDRLGDLRIRALWDKINQFRQTIGIDLMVWEDVQFSSSTAQTQLWSSLRTTLWLTSHIGGIEVECCPVGTLKKFSTGHGGATKDMMAEALVRKDSRFILRDGIVVDTQTGIFLTDDAVDAIHLLEWVKQIRKNIRQ